MSDDHETKHYFQARYDDDRQDETTDHFIFALERLPEIPLNLDTLSVPDYVENTPRHFCVTITGTFEQEDLLIAATQELRDLLAQIAQWYAANPTAQQQLLSEDAEGTLEAPVAAWLTAHNLPLHQVGIGWPGEVNAVAGAVSRIGQTIFVHGLKLAEVGYGDELDRNPLIAIFEALGAKVVVEGEFESSVVVDLTCSCQEEVADQLVAEIADYLDLYYYICARPPWHPMGISPAEARARATFGRRSIERPPHPEDDPTIVEKLKHQSRETEWWVTEFGPYVGQLRLIKQDNPWDPKNPWKPAPDEPPLTANYGRVRQRGANLDVGWMIFQQFEYGFPAFLRYLAARGCTDMRYDLVDFNAVRGD